MDGHTGPLFQQAQSQQASVLPLHRGLCVPLTPLACRTGGHPPVWPTAGGLLPGRVSNTPPGLFLNQIKAQLAQIGAQQHLASGTG